MALDRAFVFRQLDGAARFTRFGAEDMGFPILVLMLATFASLAIGFHPLYSGAAFAAAAAASWLLRMSMEEPPMTVVFYLLAPKHYSPLAPDRQQKPYPAAPPR